MTRRLRHVLALKLAPWLDREHTVCHGKCSQPTCIVYGCELAKRRKAQEFIREGRTFRQANARDN